MFIVELQEPSEILVSIIEVFAVTEGTVTIASPPESVTVFGPEPVS